MNFEREFRSVSSDLLNEGATIVVAPVSPFVLYMRANFLRSAFVVVFFSRTQTHLVPYRLHPSMLSDVFYIHSSVDDLNTRSRKHIPWARLGGLDPWYKPTTRGFEFELRRHKIAGIL